MPILTREEWIERFAAEYLRRTLLTAEDRGCSDGELADRYYPDVTPTEAVTHQIEKYDLTDFANEDAWVIGQIQG